LHGRPLFIASRLRSRFISGNLVLPDGEERKSILIGSGKWTTLKKKASIGRYGQCSLNIEKIHVIKL
jgi:hypothetical protein